MTSTLVLIPVGTEQIALWKLITPATIIKNPTARFSDRIENYVRFHFGYPHEIFPCLIEKIRLASSAVIANLASGTGLLTKLFLKEGYSVSGEEPNPEMRAAAECNQNNFVSMD